MQLPVWLRRVWFPRFWFAAGNFPDRRFDATAPHFQKTAMGSEVLAVAERVVPDDQVHGMGLAKRAKGHRSTGWDVFSARRRFSLLADLLVHSGLFHSPKAELSPAGYGHLLDEGVFDGGFGLEFVFQFREDFEEAVATLGFEHDGFGEQAVFYGVAGGVALALGRDGSAGPGSVSTGGLDLTFSSHFDLVIAWEKGEPAEFEGVLLISGEI